MSFTVESPSVVANYTSDEEDSLRAALAHGGRPPCPRCSGPLTRHEVPPRPDVAYVRDRIWLLCDGCGRSLVVDRKRIPPAARAE